MRIEYPGAQLVGVPTKADSMEVNVKVPQIPENNLLFDSAVPLLDISPRTLLPTTKRHRFINVPNESVHSS